MSIPPSEVIARTVAVLEEICVLLEEEAAERTHTSALLADAAVKCRDANDAVQVAISKLLRAETVLAPSQPAPLTEYAPHDPVSDDNASETPAPAGHAGLVR